MKSHSEPPKKLKETQEWFASIIVKPIDENSCIDPISPTGRTIEEEARDHIAPSPSLEPKDRIEIYNQQFWWRVLATLHEEFPLLTRLFGYKDFNNIIAIPYITRYLPNHWSLSFLGNRLSKWIDEYYHDKDKKVVLESAALDWAYNYSFIAPHHLSLGYDTCQSQENVQPLMTTPVFLQPHIFLFSFEYDLFLLRNEFLECDPHYWTQHPFPILKRDRPYWFIFYRDLKNLLVYEEISYLEYTLLTQLKEVNTLDAALEWINTQSAQVQEEASASLSHWLERWIINQWLAVQKIDHIMTGTPHSKLPSQTIKTNNPREAAYLAVWLASKEEVFASEFLDSWSQASSPNSADFGLAMEIAFGTLRMALALDYLGAKLADKQKLNLKTREKILFRTALYQFYFMDRIPAYAIVNETIQLAKKYCHETFVRFLNASLRKISNESSQLPKGDSISDLSIRLSYPPYFIEELSHHFPKDQVLAIMEAGNFPGCNMARVRPHAKMDIENTDGLERFKDEKSNNMVVVRDSSLLKFVAISPDFYIQNVSPVNLIHHLAIDRDPPKRILDLCSSPGGKLIAVHDLFPKADLTANDVSEIKLKPVADNCRKYGIDVLLTCSRGENYPTSDLFDIVILDVPCSNSGVLNKRPEARWRISPNHLKELETVQLQLLEKASQLLTVKGEIWYMTCSILPIENDHLIQKACDLFNLKLRLAKTILPSQEGWDGGFACALYKDQ